MLLLITLISFYAIYPTSVTAHPTSSPPRIRAGTATLSSTETFSESTYSPRALSKSGLGTAAIIYIATSDCIDGTLVWLGVCICRGDTCV
jgi:hypothetical protein